jgi:multicomponent K+:H+ antiporter subunit D
VNALLPSWLAAHLPVLPVLLPSLTAMAMLMLCHPSGEIGHDDVRLRWRRRISIASAATGLFLAVQLMIGAHEGALAVYRLGDWPAPFGIVLVVDRLSALMLVLSYLIALPVLWYAAGGWDAHGRHFHALFQFQLMGLSGAFVTGDLFNLFVFFEVLLIASYVLLVHGQGEARYKAGVHYVVLNLAASALFLIGVALLYAMTGTLNMADLSLRVAQVGAEQAPVLQAAALMLLVVFGLKAAVVPLYMWLPRTYAEASAPVAALFAIMTKVGVYSIVRVHTVIFGAQAGASAQTAEPWILPIALATGALGVLGALASNSMARMVAYLTVASVGTILAGVGLFTSQALSAALYYMAHSTLVIAGLFLLVELVASQRGAAQDNLRPAQAVAQPVVLGLMMLLGAASVAGLPPLPGFLGKLMILDSAVGLPAQPWVWSVVLGVGFLTLVGLARAGTILFWSVLPDPPKSGAASASGSSPRLITATLSLLLAGVVMAVFASPLKRYTDATAEQLRDHAAYAAAVLGPLGGAQAATVRPYTGSGAVAPPVKKE